MFEGIAELLMEWMKVEWKTRRIGQKKYCGLWTQTQIMRCWVSNKYFQMFYWFGVVVVVVEEIGILSEWASQFLNNCIVDGHFWTNAHGINFICNGCWAPSTLFPSPVYIVYILSASNISDDSPFFIRRITSLSKLRFVAMTPSAQFDKPQKSRTLKKYYNRFG